jgi:hypothetical protein
MTCKPSSPTRWHGTQAFHARKLTLQRHGSEFMPCLIAGRSECRLGHDVLASERRAHYLRGLSRDRPYSGRICQVHSLASGSQQMSPSAISVLT